MLHGRSLILGLMVGCALGFFARGLSSGPEPRCQAGLVFEDALISAGSVDYIFATTSLSQVSLRIANEDAQHQGFEALLGKATDGPAEADPQYLGKAYSLCISKDDPAVFTLSQAAP